MTIKTSNKSKNEKTDSEESKSIKTKNTPKVDKRESAKAFIGFYRYKDGKPWTLFNKILKSEESVITKLRIKFGNVYIHIIGTELPG